MYGAAAMNTSWQHARPQSVRRHLPIRVLMVWLHWREAILSLGIIGGMLCIIGNAQYFIHKATHRSRALGGRGRLEAGGVGGALGGVLERRREL